ncbi:hypothetical protein CF326_g2543 [Tilletia indica]|nr:hypothetical protein CF326_g2543 [Tilletia indica]
MDNEEQSAAAADVATSLGPAQPVPLDPSDPAPALPKSTDDMDVDEDNSANKAQAPKKKTPDSDDEDSEDDEDAPVSARRKASKPDELNLFSDDEDEGVVKAANTGRSGSRKFQTLRDDDDEDDDDDDEDKDVDGPAAERGGGAAELSRRKKAAERARKEKELADLIPDDDDDAAPRDEDDDDDMFSGDEGGDGNKGSNADDGERDSRREQLEYRETDEPFEEETPRDFRLAQLYLPNHPVRRTKEHWLARLPNFLDYRLQPFDEETFDPETDDNAGTGAAELSVKERLADPELRMLMKTKNTMRWRWSGKVDEDGVRIPESNARILRWSDGTMSLQLGDEFFDVPLTREGGGANTEVGPAQANGIVPPGSQSLINGASQAQSSSQGAQAGAPSTQPMSFIVVPHPDAQVLQAEMPLAGTMMFRPYNLQSETHRKLAKAVKYHKVLRVQPADDLPSVDPETEKTGKEKAIRMEGEKHHKKAAKSRLTIEEEEANDIDEQLRGMSRSGEERRRGRRSGGGGGRGGGGGGAAGGRAPGGRRVGLARGRDAEEDYEVDDFIVADETDEDASGDEDAEGEDEDGEEEAEDDDDEDGEGTPRKKKKDKRRKSEAMEVDDEPDEMELAERRIEEIERAERMARQEEAATKTQQPDKSASRSKVLADSDDEDGAGGQSKPAATGGEASSTGGEAAVDADAAAEARRKKRVLMDEDEEDE